MKRLLYILLLLLPLQMMAQTATISGVVRSAADGKAVDGVNVMLQDSTRRFMYGFSLTDGEGRYSIESKQAIDKVVVAVSGFNIKATHKLIDNRTQQVNFEVEESELKIREVTVKADPINRQSDTLTYVVSQFSNVADSSIGDVLAKMPGIEVESSGAINYNGKSINKFYIEGMDMLEGRYGVATNNVSADDIASVQVYENHQPIKALTDIVKSDQAALNLTLKKDAQGTWSGTMELGGGYKPAMWSAEATAMYFGRKFQTISTYKTNNSGDDVASELTTYFDGINSATTILSITTPQLPSLNEERYLNNNVHALSVNTINKVTEDMEFTTNSKYTRDKRNSEGSSITTYILPNAEPITVAELTSATQHSQEAEIAMQIRKNTKEQYLRNKLTLNGEWLNDLGKVGYNNNDIDQNLDLDKLAIDNSFAFVKNLGRITLNVRSDTEYKSTPSQLAIAPMIYPSVFDSPVGYPNAIQSLRDRTFATRNSAFGSISYKHWRFFMNVGASAEVKSLESRLMAAATDGATLSPADTMQNHINWRKITLHIGPSVTYDLGDALNLSLALPLNYSNLHTQDKVQEETNGDNLLLLSPSLRLQSNISYNLKLSASASYNQTMGDLYDSYSGYMMSNYRTIASKDGELSRTATQYYDVTLGYGNAIHALFGSISGSYNRSHRNLMYGTTYEGALSRIESYAIDNDTDYYTLGARVSKRLTSIGTTLTLSGKYFQSQGDMLVQGVIESSRMDNLSAGVGINVRLGKNAAIDYGASYSQTTSYIDDSAEEPIDVFSQNCELDFTFLKKLSGSITAEHYYNAAISGNDAQMFFMDASLGFSAKKVSYSLDINNIFNTQTFSNFATSQNSNNFYTYALRPFSVMFKIGFSIQ